MMRSTASHQRFQGQKKKERRKACIIRFSDRARMAARINIQYSHGKDSRAVICTVNERCRYSQSATPPLPLAHACKVYDRLHAHVGIVILIVDYSS